MQLITWHSFVQPPIKSEIAFHSYSRSRQFCKVILHGRYVWLTTMTSNTKKMMQLNKLKVIKGNQM